MQYVNFHTHGVVSGSELAIYNKVLGQDAMLFTKGLLYSVGIHPCYVDVFLQDAYFEQITRWSSASEVVMIGEAGMDVRSQLPLARQQELFELHIRVSELEQKPLLIHCVGYHNELIRAKKRFRPLQPWILHGFNGNDMIFNQLVANDFYFSIGKSILDLDSNISRHLMSLDDARFMLETDASSVSIAEIYKKVSCLRSVSIDFLCRQQHCNLNKLIGRDIYVR